jgi:hypothetical protein
MAKKVKYTNEQLGALADAFGKSVLTMKRWVEKNDDRLTSERAKAVISKFKKAK